MEVAEKTDGYRTACALSTFLVAFKEDQEVLICFMSSSQSSSIVSMVPAHALPAMSPPTSSQKEDGIVSTNVERVNTSKTDISEDLSVFDLLNIARRRYFISRDELISNITEASKDAFGLFDWVVLKKDYHSKVVSKFIWTLGDGKRLTPRSVEKIKKILFVFLLDVLNGVSVGDFFALKKGETLENRAKHEIKRMARKRARAAKRERVRMAQQDSRASNGLKARKQDRKTCHHCGNTFESRNKRRKHECPGQKKSAPNKGEAVLMLSKPLSGPENTLPMPPVTEPSAEREFDATVCCAFIYASSGKPCANVGSDHTRLSYAVPDSASTVDFVICKAHARSMQFAATNRSIEFIVGKTKSGNFSSLSDE
ncbi:hypothetical protein H4582DRAFT_2198849 [Lactarius indigo]|nr:hypothetical protein H4582DRAFT_2198849 [Lactarius indigo]